MNIIQKRAFEALLKTFEGRPVMQEDPLPLPHVEEVQTVPATKWQHDLDKQVNATGTVKFWGRDAAVQSMPAAQSKALAPIEFKSSL